MKIRTNAGEVDLTAEMVCKGMVFRDRKGETLTVGGRISENIWADVHDPKAHGVLLRWPEFLGCNPEIASREACERYGVHGDAAAHGFARLRDGGAVDLRNPENMRKGMVLWSPEWFGDGRVTLDSVSGTGEAGTWWNVRPCGGVVPTTAHGFIGLNANHASPEDVRRMCCGEVAYTYRDGKDVLCQCTLAIGEHEQHEDLATGVKWPAEPSTASAYLQEIPESTKAKIAQACAVVAEPRCPDCGVEPHQHHAAGCAIDKRNEEFLRRARAAPPVPLGGKCGGNFSPCRNPATVATTYRRKSDGYIDRTHDCPEHAGKCNELWEFIGQSATSAQGVDAGKAHIRARLDSAKGHFFTCSPSAIRRVLAACDLRADVHRLYPGSYRVTLEGADAVLCDAVGRWLSDNCPMDVMYDVVSTRPTCGKCAQTITDPTPMRFASDRGGGVIESVLICTRCAREIEPGTMTVRNGRIMPKFVPSNVDSMPEVRATWTGIAGLQAPTGAPQNSVERMAQHDESGVLGFCAFVAGLKRWAASPEGKRAAQERALVALVNAVPAELDPIGWRAAVLAMHENGGGIAGIAFFHRDEINGRVSIERQLRDGEVLTLAGEIAVPAYRRALAPHAKVPPERKRRGPVIVVDDGRDD